MQVPWKQLHPSEFEQLVATLLSRKYQTRRLDGSGGDGGRDCHFKGASGYDIYQIKGFVGVRLSQGGRKKQIEKSLAAALTHSPDRWTLIIGIDPTPQEEEWLDALGSGQNETAVTWHGRTWLDDQLAQFPDIVRYYTMDATAEILRQLAILDTEQSRLAQLDGGLNDAVSRLGALAEQIDELSPHYRFRWVIDGRQLSVEASPKYPGAENDAPLAISINVGDPSTAQTFRKALERLDAFGVPVELTGGELEDFEVVTDRLIGGTFQPEKIQIGRANPSAPRVDLEVRASVVDQDGRELSVETLRVTSASSGGRGFSLRAENLSRTLTAEFDVEPETELLHVHFRPVIHSGLLPKDLASVLTWIEELGAGRELRVAESATGNLIFSGKMAGTASKPVSQHFRLINALAEIQERVGVEFPLPEELTENDVFWIDAVIKLLNGEPVRVNWTELSIPLVPQERGTSLLDDEARQFVIEDELSPRIAGHLLPLGRARTHIPRANIKNVQEVRSAVEEGKSVHIELDPGPDPQPYVIWLLPVSDDTPSDPDSAETE